MKESLARQKFITKIEPSITMFYKARGGRAPEEAKEEDFVQPVKTGSEDDKEYEALLDQFGFKKVYEYSLPQNDSDPDLLISNNTDMIIQSITKYSFDGSNAPLLM